MDEREIQYHLLHSKTDQSAAVQLFSVLFKRLNKLQNQYKTVNDDQAERLETLLEEALIAVGFNTKGAEISTLATNSVTRFNGLRFFPLQDWHQSSFSIVQQFPSDQSSELGSGRIWLGLEGDLLTETVEIPLFLSVKWPEEFPEPAQDWMEAISFWAGGEQVGYKKLPKPSLPQNFGGHKSFWASLCTKAYQAYHSSIFILQVNRNCFHQVPSEVVTALDGSDEEQLSKLLWLEVRLPAGISPEKGQIEFLANPVLLSNYRKRISERLLGPNEAGKELYLSLETGETQGEFISLNRVWGKKDYREITWQQWSEVEPGYFQYFSTKHPNGNSLDNRISELSESSDALNIQLNCFLNEYSRKKKNLSNFPEKQLAEYFQGFENEENTLKEKEVSHWVRLKPKFDGIIRVEWVETLSPLTELSQEVMLDHLIYLT